MRRSRKDLAAWAPGTLLLRPNGCASVRCGRWDCGRELHVPCLFRHNRDMMYAQFERSALGSGWACILGRWFCRKCKGKGLGR